MYNYFLGITYLYVLTGHPLRYYDFVRISNVLTCKNDSAKISGNCKFSSNSEKRFHIITTTAVQRVLIKLKRLIEFRNFFLLETRRVFLVIRRDNHDGAFRLLWTNLISKEKAFQAPAYIA